MGTIMGAALPMFTRGPTPAEPTPRPLLGKNRLFTILVSESAHLIWRIRCERVIQREDDPERRHSEIETTNKWLLSLNNRLKTDIAQTNVTKYGALALAEKTVLTRIPWS